MTFQKALEAQLALQTNSFGKDPRILNNDEKLEWVRWNVLALEDELHELLAETGWKPWASSRHVNREAYIGELVDAFHFMMNLMLIVDCDADEFLNRYFEKRKINIKRQAEGYDGVSTKCSECHRALDDKSVTCTSSQCNFNK